VKVQRQAGTANAVDSGPPLVELNHQFARRECGAGYTQLPQKYIQRKEKYCRGWIGASDVARVTLLSAGGEK